MLHKTRCCIYANKYLYIYIYLYNYIICLIVNIWNVKRLDTIHISMFFFIRKEYIPDIVRNFASEGSNVGGDNPHGMASIFHQKLNGTKSQRTLSKLRSSY